MHTKRIARGAKYLDRRFPGWAEDVNPDWLQETNTGCVIGQIMQVRGGLSFSDFMGKKFLTPEGDSLWWLLYPPTIMGTIWAVSHGFILVREHEFEWRAAWKKEINARRSMFVPNEWERRTDGPLTVV